MKSARNGPKTRSPSLTSRLPELKLPSKKKSLTPRSTGTIHKKRSRTLEIRRTEGRHKRSHSALVNKNIETCMNIIALKSFIKVEAILEELLGTIGKSSDLEKAKTTYLKTISEAGYLKILNSLKETGIHSSVKRSVILELVGVHLIVKHHASVKLSKIKNLGLILHQNFLEILNLVIEKSFVSSMNNYIKSVRTLVLAKRLNQTGGIMVTKNCEIITSAIQSILTSLPSGSGLENVFYILEHIQMLSITRAKSLISGTILLKSPLLPPKNNESSYTLVLDLDETLVHFKQNSKESYILVRPFCFEFIQQVSAWYEVVVFTAAVQQYADWSINKLDPNRCIKHRLYRQHTKLVNGFWIKDLSLIGRDLSKVIIVDNTPQCFSKQPLNGIAIKAWTGDPGDNALKDLLGFLVSLAKNKPKDVRVVLGELRNEGENSPSNKIKISINK